MEALNQSNTAQRDRSTTELYRLVKEGSLNIAPLSWHRDSVWNAEDDSLFIESCLLGYAVRQFVFLDNGDQSYDVIDGLQRLKALIGFIDGEYKLTGISKESPFYKKEYSDLSTVDQRRFDQYSFLTYAVSHTVSLETIQELYLRLN